MSDDEVKKEIKEDHINIKVKDMVRVMRASTTRARARARAHEKIDVCLKVDCLTSSSCCCGYDREMCADDGGVDARVG